jgi:hypothetical protein
LIHYFAKDVQGIAHPDLAGISYNVADREVFIETEAKSLDTNLRDRVELVCTTTCFLCGPLVRFILCQNANKENHSSEGDEVVYPRTSRGSSTDNLVDDVRLLFIHLLASQYVI